MTLRNLHWLTAGLLAAAAVIASSARSQAGIQILIQEVNSSGTPVGTAQYFTTAGVSGLSTTHFDGVGVNVTTSSGTVSILNTMTSTVTAQPGGAFDPAFGLRVWVTDDGFLTPTFPVPVSGILRNSNSQSASVFGGSNIVTNNSLALNSPAAMPPANTGIGGPTPDATSIVSVPGDSAASPTTTAVVSVLPAAFAIQQTITIRATPLPGQSIDSQSTLGGSATSNVLVNVLTPGVPAPGGLALALIGLPILGFRRLRRKKN